VFRESGCRMTASHALPRLRLNARPQIADRIRVVLEQDALSIAVIAAWTALLAVWMPKLLVQDSWLAFVNGRLIAQHGVPHTETLTFWSLGRSWTDQQWGAHLALYELVHYGGLGLVLAFGIACVTVSVGLAAVAARKLGASSGSTAIGLLLPLLGAPWMTQVRAQSLALVPFVLVYALLAFDARQPRRRVLFVLPVLVVWANLHGSVVMASGLTALYGLTLLRRREARHRALLLVAGAPLCILASPYGFGLVAYYRLMLVNSPLQDFVQEWKAPTVQAATAVFFVSAFAITALWARHPRSVTPFERWAIALLLIAALTAVRNVIWFELAAAVTFPRMLDAVWKSRATPTRGVRRINLLVASVAIVATVAVLAAQLARPSTWLERDRSPAIAAAVAAAAGPQGIVLADDAHADWLLWQQPSLAGRVAYDVRFELFNRHELIQLSRLQQAAPPAWRRCGAGAKVVTFAGSGELQQFVEAGVLAPGRRMITRGPQFAAIAQPSPAPACQL
jgi:hypothetical protein